MIKRKKIENEETQNSEKEYIYCLLVEDHPVTKYTKVPL